jgi:hypothetical protein
MSNFTPVTDSHLFPAAIAVGDSVEVTIKVNGAEALTYTKVIDSAPESNGKLLASITIVEQA